MRAYSRNSFELNIKREHIQDIKDVAIALEQELEKQNTKFSIDVCGLLFSFIWQCKEYKEPLPSYSLYLVSRIEGSLTAVDCFHHRYGCQWIPNKILYKFFVWYGYINPKYIPKFLKR